MPAHPFQTSFTSGELTDFLASRVDWDKYARGARCLENWVVRTQGGISRRAGSIYLGPSRDASRLAILYPFQFSITQSYMLEIGHEYIRVWTNRDLLLLTGDGYFASGFFATGYFGTGFFTAAGATELVTPYQEDELRSLRFEQSADVLYITHRNHAPRKLIRVTTSEFQLNVINFLPTPSAEIAVEPSATLTLSAMSGSSVTATASASVWLAGDVGRQILSGAGRAIITAVGGATSATVNILDAFSTTGPIAAGEWEMDGSPNAGTLTVNSLTPPNVQTSITVNLDTFRSTDIGKYVIRGGSTFEIIGFTTAQSITAQVLSVSTFDDDTGVANAQAFPGTWTLESPAWSDALGWPGVVALGMQRLWFAGTNTFPDRVWASVVADYEAFGRGSDDDAALDITLASPGVNLIRWLKFQESQMAVGTIAAENSLEGGNDEPITPSNVRVREVTRYGADEPVDAIRSDRAILFLQRGARRIRELARDEFDRPFAPDLTIAAEHLTREGVLQMAHATSPDSFLFAVTGAGTLAVLTYERPENVVGWTHALTDGDYESVAVKPNDCGTGDEVWTIVNRSITQGRYFHVDYFHEDYFASGYFAPGGVASGRRYLEVFDGSMRTDAGLVYSGVAASVFTGLDHLESETVKAIDQDGNVYSLTVSAGQVTTPNPATELEIGLGYTATMQSMRPEVPSQAGTSMGRRRKWDHVSLLVYCTQGVLLLDGEAINYPAGSTQPYTGWLRRKMHAGWDEDSFLVVQTQDPLPATILGVTGSFQMEDA